MPVLDSLRATARLHSQHRWELQNGVLWRTDRCADISQERGEHPNDPNERSERFRPAKRQPRCPAAPPWRTGAGLATPFQEEWIGVRPWPLMDVVTSAVHVVKRQLIQQRTAEAAPFQGRRPLLRFYLNGNGDSIENSHFVSSGLQRSY